MESSPLFIQVHRLSTEYLNRVQCNPKVTWNWGLIGEAAKAATSTAERSSERAKEQRDPLFLDPTEVDLKDAFLGNPGLTIKLFSLSWHLFSATLHRTDMIWCALDAPISLDYSTSLQHGLVIQLKNFLDSNISFWNTPLGVHSLLS